MEKGMQSTENFIKSDAISDAYSKYRRIAQAIPFNGKCNQLFIKFQDSHSANQFERCC